MKKHEILISINLVFQFLDFLGDITLAVGKGLLTDVVVGNLVHKGLGNFNIVAEYPVVADLQGADTGLFPFLGFQLQDHICAALH